MKDKIGQEITPGSYIVYGHLLGRCAGLRIGKVLKVEEGVETRGGREQPWYKITVRGTEDSGGEEPRLSSKNGRLLYPDRIIVLGEDATIPYEYFKVLEPVEIIK